MVNFGGRSLYFEEGLPPPKASSLAGSRRGLVDLTRALGRVRGAHVNRGAALLELELVSLGVVLDYVDQVLGVSGVADTLDVRTLVAVATLASDREVLVNISALAFLLFLLSYLCYGRYSGHGEHRQKRRQQHQLPHVVSPPCTRLLFVLIRSRIYATSRSGHDLRQDLAGQSRTAPGPGWQNHPPSRTYRPALLFTDLRIGSPPPYPSRIFT